MATEKQPKIKLKAETTDHLLDLFLFVLLAIIVAISIYGLVVLPNEIPVKYDGNHNAISYGSKMVLLIVPFMALVLGFALRWLKNYPHIFNYPYKITERNIETQYRLAQRLVMWINIIETMMFAYLSVTGIISAQRQHSVTDMRIAVGLALLLFVAIFVYLRKAKALSLSGNYSPPQSR